MSNPSPIYAITQFSGGTGAVWRAMSQPLPAGVLSIESDTGIVKMGDGATLYANLPVFFNARYLQDVEVSSLACQQAAAQSAASATLAAGYAEQVQAGSAVSATTTSAVPVILTGTGSVPDGVSVQRLVGQITAQNILTGAAASWDLSALAIRRGTGVSATMPLPPTVAVFYADETMLACTVSVTVSPNGFVLTVTGLADTTIAWTGALSFSGTAQVVS